MPVNGEGVDKFVARYKTIKENKEWFNARCAQANVKKDLGR